MELLYWRVSTIKLASEESSDLLSSKKVTMGTELQPTSKQPINITLRTYQQAVPTNTQCKQSTWKCPCKPPLNPAHNITAAAALA